MTAKPKDDVHQAYQEYRLKSTPDRLNAVVDALRPTIDYAVVSTGGIDDPIIRHQARLYAADAVRNFDPQAGADLRTWTSRNLMQLRRFRRARNSPMKLPERVQLDAFTIDTAERELTDKLGREPTLDEIGSATGMPPKRIRKVREAFRKTPGEGGLPDGVGGTSEIDHGPEALDYVFAGADTVDKQIIRFMTGYGGEEPLTPKQTAERLGLTPSTLSRRRARLGLLVQDMERALQQTSSL